MAQEEYYDYGFVGGSLGVGQTVFSEDSAGFIAEPNLFYNGEYGFIDGGLLNVAVMPWLGITGQWRFAEVSDDFDSLPSGIESREGNGELGLTLGTVGARLTFLNDVTSVHNGYEIQLHLGRVFDTPIDHFAVSPYVELDYRDQNLSEHLYGISAQEAAASGLAQFNADSSWVYQAGLIGIYDITPDWLGIIKAEFTHHDSDSPLVRRDLGWAVTLGVSYKFTD
ncbi:MipA/OmpV family protein [Parasalinivibrio latis]